MACPMSHQSMQENIMVSLTKLSEDDKNPIVSRIAQLLVAIDDTTSLDHCHKNLILNLLSIVEYLVENKKMISNDKLNIYKKNIHHTKSTVISHLESILIDLNLSPFLNKYSMDMFHMLWYHLTTDLPDLITTSLSGYSNNSTVGFRLYRNPNLSQKNKNYLKTLYQSLRHLPLENTVEEGIDNILVSRKIRLLPSKNYIDLFWRCFEATCFTYNKTVLGIQEEYTKKYGEFKKMRKKGCVFINSKKEQCKKKCVIFDNKCKSFFCKTHKNKKLKYDVKLSAIYWRDKIMGSKKNLIDYGEYEYIKEISHDTRFLAIKTAVANMKACITNIKSGRIKTFHIRQKSKHFKKQFFHVDPRYLKEKDEEFCLFNKQSKGESLEMKEKEWLLEYFNKYTNKDYKNIENNKIGQKHRHAMIVTYDSGRYFLIVPYEKQVKKNKIKNKIVAIDPGVRTFHTFYSPDGMTGELGDKMDKKLIKIHKRRDKMFSKISNYNNKLKELNKSENKTQSELDKLDKKMKQIEKTVNKLKIKEKAQIKSDNKRNQVRNKVTDSISSEIIRYLNKLIKIKSKLRVTRRDLKKTLKKKLIKSKKYIIKKLHNLDHKVANIVKDAHRKIASYYCKNYKTIVIPQFDVNGIKKKLKKERKSKKDDRIRKLMSLKHGEFMERLKYKCKVTGTGLWIVSEEYTTKSCGNCGLLNNPEVSKKYKCTKCKLKVGRDTNAARNILIKNISMHKLEGN